MVIGGRITVLFLGSCVSQFPVGMERSIPESEMVGRYGGRQQEPDTDCSHFFCTQEAEKVKHRFKNKNFYCVFSFL